MAARGKIATPFAVILESVAEALGAATWAIRVRVKEVTAAKLPDGWTERARPGGVRDGERRMRLVGGGREATCVAPDEEPGVGYSNL